MARTVLLSRSQIGLRAPRSRSTNLAPRGIVLHYMGGSPWTGGAGSANHNRCASIWRAIQAQHMTDPNAADIYYSSGVCPHGVRLEGRGPGVRHGANGDSEGNRVSYAVCMLIGGADRLTDGLVWGLLDEMDRYGLPFRWPHSAWFPTACCGDPGRAWLAAGCPSPSGASPVPQPNPILPPPIQEDPVPAFAIGTNGENRIERFSLDGEGRVMHSWQAAPGSRDYSPWAALGTPPGARFVALDVLAKTTGILVVQALTAFGEVWQIRQTAGKAGGFSWGDWGKA